MLLLVMVTMLESILVLMLLLSAAAMPLPSATPAAVGALTGDKSEVPWRDLILSLV